VGALGRILIGGGGILDRGGLAEAGTRMSGGGGGSGGGIFLHADSVALDSVLYATGGAASAIGAGGGGGGRVLILTGPDGFTNHGTINVAGGIAVLGNSGEDGTVTISSAPEPSTLALLGLGGALALLDYARRRCRRRAAGCTG
jgi:hypothetical protein